MNKGEEELMRKYIFTNLCACLILVGMHGSCRALQCPSATLLKINLKHIQKTGKGGTVWLSNRLWKMSQEQMKLLQKTNIKQIGRPQNMSPVECDYTVTYLDGSEQRISLKR
jgi:hypothetical protein